MRIKLKDEEATRQAKLYQGSKNEYKEAEILDVSGFTYFVKFSNGKFANVHRSYIEEVIEDELTKADTINLLMN